MPVVGVTPQLNVAVLQNSTFKPTLELLLLPFNVMVGAVVPVVVVSVCAGTAIFTYLYVVPAEFVHFIP